MVFDWLIDWLIDWLTDWMIDRSIDWLIDWLIVFFLSQIRLTWQRFAVSCKWTSKTRRGSTGVCHGRPRSSWWLETAISWCACPPTPASRAPPRCSSTCWAGNIWPSKPTFSSWTMTGWCGQGTTISATFPNSLTRTCPPVNHSCRRRRKSSCCVRCRETIPSSRILLSTCSIFIRKTFWVLNIFYCEKNAKIFFCFFVFTLKFFLQKIGAVDESLWVFQISSPGRDCCVITWKLLFYCFTTWLCAALIRDQSSNQSKLLRCPELQPLIFSQVWP